MTADIAETDSEGLPTLVRTTEGVRVVTLNRPKVANALLPSQRDHLIDLLLEASSDRDIRAILIRAEGKHFCSGADLSAGNALPDEPVVGDVARTLRRGAQRLIEAVLDCEKPIVTAVRGAAAGLGAHLVLASDYVVASQDARLIEVFVKRSLVPDGGGIYLLSRHLGPLRTKQLCMFGDALPAAKALEWGLVSELVDPDQLDQRALEIAGSLAAGPTRMIAYTKALINRASDSDRAQCFSDEALAQELNLTTTDFDEAAQAFAQRRAPRFRGY